MNIVMEREPICMLHFDGGSATKAIWHSVNDNINIKDKIWRK